MYTTGGELLPFAKFQAGLLLFGLTWLGALILVGALFGTSFTIALYSSFIITLAIFIFYFGFKIYLKKCEESVLTPKSVNQSTSNTDKKEEKLKSVIHSENKITTYSELLELQNETQPKQNLEPKPKPKPISSYKALVSLESLNKPEPPKEIEQPVVNKEEKAELAKYNLYTKKCARIQEQVIDIQEKLTWLNEDLMWLNSFDIDDLNNQYKNTEQRKKLLIKDATTLENKIERLNLKIKDLQTAINSSSVSFKLINTQHKINKDSLSQSVNHLNELELELEHVRANFLAEEKLLSKVSKELSKYNSFNKDDLLSEVSRLEAKQHRKESELSNSVKQSELVDEKLKPIISQILGYQSNIQVANDNIQLATQYRDSLSEADSSYDRAKIHQECEESLGEGNPKKYIYQQERYIKQLNRDLDKTKDRACKAGELYSREIRKIVIDGNNVCYEDGQFVGLAPSIKLSEVVSPEYDVIIVFDSSIRAMLKMNDEQIRSKYHPNTKIHIVASKQLADETVLDVASDKFSYVISNDRFGEYQDKDVVRENRLIKHEVIDGMILVNALNVKAIYSIKSKVG